MKMISYPVIDNIEISPGVIVPLLDIPMMSDERWNELAAQSKNHSKQEGGAFHA